MSWPLVRVDDIKSPSSYSLVGGPFGSNLTSKDYRENGVPVIRGVNLPEGKKFHNQDFAWVSEEKANQLRQNNAYPGDIVFTQRGTLGQVGLIPEQSEFQRYLLSQSQMKLTVNRDKALSEYVYYVFSSDLYKNLIRGMSITSGVPHINLGILKRIGIRLPPLPQQRSIVDLIASYDELIENNRRRIQLLEESARLLYREWFVHLRFPGHEHVRIVDGVPERWERKAVGNIAETLGGGTPSTKHPEYWEGGEVVWFTPTDLTRNDCLALLDSEKKITEEGLKRSSAKRLPPRTLLMTSRASIGYFGLYDGQATTNQGFIAIIPADDHMRMFLLHQFMSRVDEIAGLAGGTTYREINKTTFRSLEVLVPPAGMCEEFERFATDIFDQVQILKKQNQKLAEARDLLLPRLMNGEIAV